MTNLIIIFVVYNIKTTKVLGIYDHSSNEFLKLWRNSFAELTHLGKQHPGPEHLQSNVATCIWARESQETTVEFYRRSGSGG